MEKKIKKINPIFAFVLGILLTAGTVYAVTTISATSVGFTSKKGLTSTDVQGAIDEVYADVITLDNIEKKTGCISNKKIKGVPVSPSTHYMDLSIYRNNKITTMYINMNNLSQEQWSYYVTCPSGGECKIEYTMNNLDSNTFLYARPYSGRVTVKDVPLQNANFLLYADIDYESTSTDQTLRIRNIRVGNSGTVIAGQRYEYEGQTYTNGLAFLRSTIGSFQTQFSYVNSAVDTSCQDSY